MPPRKKKEAVEGQEPEAPKYKRVDLLTSLKQSRRTMYTVFEATIQFREKVLGATPLNEKLLEGFLGARLSQWLKAIEKGKANPPKAGTPEEETLRQLEEIKHQVDLEKEETTASCGFKRDTVGFYFEPRVFKAMLKVAANGLGLTKRPPLGAKQDLQHFIHVKPLGWKPGDAERIYFLRGDKPIAPLRKMWKGVENGELTDISVQAPTYKVEVVEVPNVDGRHQRPIQVDTPQGPRSTIVRNDFFESTVDRPVQMKFEIWLLKTRKETQPSETELLTMLAVGEEEGLGASRSQGFGKFDFVAFSLLREEEVEE